MTLENLECSLDEALAAAEAALPESNPENLAKLATAIYAVQKVEAIGKMLSSAVSELNASIAELKN